MSSGLSQENEQFLQRAVATGMYHDRNEAIDVAVEILRRREQLIRDVNKGIEQLERGECGPFDIEEIKAEVERESRTS